MKYILLTCAVALSVLTLSAQVVTPTVQTTGMIGIADGETAQLNLLNPGLQALTPAAGVLCSAVVSFVDSTGAVLKTMSLTIPPGQSMSASIRSLETPLSLLLPGERREIRAIISTPAVIPVTVASSTAATTCNLIPTLEILDTMTARTLAVLGRVETVPPAPVTTP
jgi:hypothetical protein